MKIRRLILVTLMAGLTLPLMAQTKLPADEAGALKALEASPRHGEYVSIPVPGQGPVTAWVVYPERADQAGVVLVVHEIFGLTDWARGVADQLAAEGFIAIAPDFLTGKGPKGQGSASVGKDGARPLIGALKMEEITARLDAAYAYGSQLPSGNGRIGIVGFCWGGGISFGYATTKADLKASVVYYGTSPATASLVNLKAPVLGLYGGADARVDATIPDAQAELKRLNKSFEANLYEGAGHAFLRQLDGMNGANLKAAQAAWPRTLAFLRAALEAKPVSRLSPPDDCCDPAVPTVVALAATP